jgi:hypothetical protein
MKTRSLIVLGLAWFALGWHPPAEAGFVLSFNASSYTISPSGTAQVQVFLSQTPGGPQISSTNTLLTAAIAVSFNNPSGVTSVRSVADITANPAFDASSAGRSSTQATLSETSLLGLSTLPVLLGTFTFSPVGVGTTQITVAPLPMSFSASQSGVLPDPTSATATVNVTPEPSSVIVALTGSPVLLAGLVLRRRRRRPLVA